MTAFSWLSHDREGFCALPGAEPSALMKRLLASHPPEVTSASAGSFFPRQGAFIADRIIVGRYPRDSGGNGPR